MDRKAFNMNVQTICGSAVSKRYDAVDWPLQHSGRSEVTALPDPRREEIPYRAVCHGHCQNRDQTLALG